MMEPGSGESAGTDASATEPMIPSGTVAEGVSGEAGRKDTPPEPEDPVRRRTSGRQRRASLEEYRETYLTVPKIRNRKTVFVSEDVRDELDAIVRRLGGRGLRLRRGERLGPPVRQELPRQQRQRQQHHGRAEHGAAKGSEKFPDHSLLLSPRLTKSAQAGIMYR